MKREELLNRERTRIVRWAKFQLAHKWKHLGLFICLLTFLALLTLKFLDGDFLMQKFLLKRVLLVGLLIIAISKDKIEDEMIVSLRSKSMRLAFVLAVLYALIQPLINSIVFYIVDYKDPSYYSFSYLQVLFFMLIIQILFFEVLKRNR